MCKLIKFKIKCNLFAKFYREYKCVGGNLEEKKCQKIYCYEIKIFSWKFSMPHKIELTSYKDEIYI